MAQVACLPLPAAATASADADDDAALTFRGRIHWVIRTTNFLVKTIVI